MSVNVNIPSTQDILIEQITAKLEGMQLSHKDDGSEHTYILVEPVTGIDLKLFTDTKTIVLSHAATTYTINARGPMDFNVEDFKKAIIARATTLRESANYFINLLNGGN